MIYRFDSLTSTNDEAQSESYSHGDIIVAERQSAGRGQRGNRWLSGEGLNLTLSAVVSLEQIEVRRQFLISQAAALAICDMLISKGISPKIKWTNDIYVGDEKIAGILIENRLSGSIVARSVVGIGLNVNQMEFDPQLPNPTSMALVAGAQLPREEILEQLSDSLWSRYEMIRRGECDKIIEHYHALMYRRGEQHSFRLPSQEIKQGVIDGVKPSGELIIDWVDGQRGAYLFGEIDFVIERRKR